MRKRGQISMYVLIGLMIIVVIGAFFYAKSYVYKKNLDKEISIAALGQKGIPAIISHIDSCLKDSTETAAIEFGIKGGNYNPDSGIITETSGMNEINILSNYDVRNGYTNELFSLDLIEEEIAAKIEVDIEECINLQQFRNVGFQIERTAADVEIDITDYTIKASLYMPTTITREESTTITEFEENVAIPFGRIYKTVLDIINKEATTGIFNKELYMLSQGDKMVIEKHKPYPNIIYTIKHALEGRKFDYVFEFAIKGEDTVGEEILEYRKTGICIDEENKVCTYNVKEKDCINQSYTYKKNGDCGDNLKPTATGCCQSSGNCFVTSEQICKSYKGNFKEGDVTCSKSNCNNLDCKKTYNYVTNSMTGPERKNGESWCNYDSLNGKGRDYVGSRHYLHSCLNGIEYVEECRDYREELCTEGEVNNEGTTLNVAQCRLNRWYDCSEQETKELCEDSTVRDCYWSDFIRSDRKCHPEIPPGLKHWDDSQNNICNIGSSYEESISRKRPITWGHAIALYCQRSGDCGNYRNIADEATKFGYIFTHKPIEDWILWDDGYHEKGNDYNIELELNTIEMENSVEIPEGIFGGDAICNLWKAPQTGKCGMCDDSDLHPCTEYKCRSLGKNCVYSEAEKKCSSGGELDKKDPEIIIEMVGSSHTKSKSLYYPNTYQYEVSAPVRIHTPVKIEFRTSEETMCKLSLYPPKLSLKAAALPYPEIMLNENGYKQEYSFDLRLPSSNFTATDEYNIFIRCTDKAGNLNSHKKLIKINTFEDENAISPTIIDINTFPDQIIINETNEFDIFLSEPIDECAYSFEKLNYNEMFKINCSANENQIRYTPWAPLGSFECRNEITVPDAKQLFFMCLSQENKTSNHFVFEIQ